MMTMLLLCSCSLVSSLLSLYVSYSFPSMMLLVPKNHVSKALLLIVHPLVLLSLFASLALLHTRSSTSSREWEEENDWVNASFFWTKSRDGSV